MKWETIFANNIFDERIISKIYKELIPLNSKLTNSSIKNEQRT